MRGPPDKPRWLEPVLKIRVAREGPRYEECKERGGVILAETYSDDERRCNPT